MEGISLQLQFGTFYFAHKHWIRMNKPESGYEWMEDEINQKGAVVGKVAVVEKHEKKMKLQ